MKLKSPVLNKYFVHEGKNIKPISQVVFNLTCKPRGQAKFADSKDMN